MNNKPKDREDCRKLSLNISRLVALAINRVSKLRLGWTEDAQGELDTVISDLRLVTSWLSTLQSNLKPLENQMNNYRWALLQLESGKRIRRKCWDPTCYFSYENGLFIHQINTVQNVLNSIPTDFIRATDWELYDEKSNFHDIGWAVKHLRTGYRLARQGWNGKNMYIELQVPDENSKMSLPYVYMRTATGDLVPWMCSQSDLMATDWEVLDV